MKKKQNKEELTFKYAYLHERRDFGQAKAYSQFFQDKKTYDRKRQKKEDRKHFADYD